MCFNSFVRDRLQKLSSEFISMRMDKTLWQYIFGRYLAKVTRRPWKICSLHKIENNDNNINWKYKLSQHTPHQVITKTTPPPDFEFILSGS
ncbi:unnamed protein product [Clonostachys rosea]|uniref:Uncharacterized protein n=1 Tax=Bionectria ochroleuca TaxID=29856 RepID=A0ABY6TY32_BIOOC|nr:unnamed protein product [Clonostachys rosea]